MLVKHRLVRAGIGGLLLAGVATGCGGTSLPEPPPCVTPTPTRVAETSSGRVNQYFRTVAEGEAQLNSLLAAFRERYPDGQFYRSSAFRNDWVIYAGSASCTLADMAALAPPEDAEPEIRGRDAELEAILTDYQVYLDRGTNAVRQRNTSDYRSFNRNVDDANRRLAEFVDRGVN
jgi:hypothetical protein